MTKDKSKKKWVKEFRNFLISMAVVVGVSLTTGLILNATGPEQPQAPKEERVEATLPTSPTMSKVLENKGLELPDQTSSLEHMTIDDVHITIQPDLEVCSTAFPLKVTVTNNTGVDGVDVLGTVFYVKSTLDGNKVMGDMNEPYRFNEQVGNGETGVQCFTEPHEVMNSSNNNYMEYHYYPIIKQVVLEDTMVAQDGQPTTIVE